MSERNKMSDITINPNIEPPYQYPRVNIMKSMDTIEVIDQCERTGHESILLLKRERDQNFRLQPVYQLSMEGKPVMLKADPNQVLHPNCSNMTFGDMEYRYAKTIEHLEGLVRDCVQALQVCSDAFDRIPTRHKGIEYTFGSYVGEHHVEKADHYIERAIGRVAVSNMELVKPLTGSNLSTGTSEEQEIDAWVAKYSSTKP